MNLAVFELSPEYWLPGMTIRASEARKASGWGVGFACGCPGFKSRFSLWFGFVSGRCPGFNSTCQLGFLIVFLSNY